VSLSLTLAGSAPKLRPAWYRGARFYVEDAGGDYGRRFADHEYPGRDTPYAEPLGRRQRVWPMTGYTIGPLFRVARDALLAACESDGVGDLIHPALGMVRAVCRRVVFSEQREVGRRCTFTLEFAEPGELEEPSATENTDMIIEGAADDLGSAAAAAFVETFSVGATLSYVATGAAIDVQYLAVTLEASRMPASGYPQAPAVEAIDVLYGQATGLVRDPPGLCTATEAAFGATSNAAEPVAVADAFLAIANDYTAGARAVDVATFAVLSNPQHSGAFAVDPPGTRYPASTRQSRNQAAWQGYCRQLALREVGYCTPGIPIESRQDALDLGRRITAAFDGAETAAADAGDDAVFIGLIRLRAAIQADIEARNARSVLLVLYKTERNLNSLVLAWKFYQDANRDIELVEAVNAYTPAFMPRTGSVRAT